MEALQGPLSPEDRMMKARNLAQDGVQGFDAALRAEGEPHIRQRAAVACESAFHALTILADVLTEQARHPPVEDHDRRIEALQDIGRSDLADLYEKAKSTLHTSG